MIVKRGGNTSLTPPPFIEVSVPSRKSVSSCICVLGVSSLLLSTIIFIGFRNCYISLVVLFLFLFFVFLFFFFSLLHNTGINFYIVEDHHVIYDKYG